MRTNWRGSFFGNLDFLVGVEGRLQAFPWGALCPKLRPGTRLGFLAIGNEYPSPAVCNEPFGEF